MDVQHSFMFGHTFRHLCSVPEGRSPSATMSGLRGCGNVMEWDCIMRKGSESPGFLPILKRLIARTSIPRCNAYARLILHRLLV